MRGPDPAALLARAIISSAAGAGLTVATQEHPSIPWHSATFSGHRHALTITAPAGAAIHAWLANVKDLDVRFPRELLADLAVAQQLADDDHWHVRIEALTVMYAPDPSHATISAAPFAEASSTCRSRSPAGWTP